MAAAVPLNQLRTESVTNNDRAVHMPPFAWAWALFGRDRGDQGKETPGQQK